MALMKVNRPAIDSQKPSNTSETASKQEVQKTNATTNVQSRWENSVFEQGKQSGAVDPNALVQSVLRESYLQTTEDLRFYAEKVKYFNETKKEIRDHLSKLRDYDKNLRPDVDSLKPGKPIESNVMERLAAVLKESVKDSNEDQKYYLGKLDGLNKIAAAITQYEQRISDASKHLAAKEKKDDDD
jgi:hypothetical protein